MAEGSFFSSWPHRLALVASHAHHSLLEWAGATHCADCCRSSISPMEKQHFPRRARDLACPNPQESLQRSIHAELRPITDRRRILYGLAEGSFFSTWPRRFAIVASHARHSLLEVAGATRCADCCRISISLMEKQHFPRRARDLACSNPQASLQRSIYAELRPIADRRRILYGLAEGSFFSTWPRRFALVASHARHSLLEWAGATHCADCCRISISPMEKQHFPRRTRDLACSNPQASL